MRARPLRLVAVASALVGLLLVSVARPAPAAVPRAPTPTTCQSFRDYYELVLLVQYAAALADAGSQSGDAIRNQYLLVLSPKLQAVSRSIARSSDDPLATLFRDQARIFGQGAKLLQSAGLTPAQVKALAAAPVDFKEIDRVLGEVALDSNKLATAGQRFAGLAAGLDLAHAPREQFQAYSRTGESCGTFPKPPVGCSKLVTAAEATAVLGAKPKIANEDGSCTFNAKTSDGEARGLAVDVYASPTAYDEVLLGTSPQDASGVAPAGRAFDGYNAFSGNTTCGRTLAARDARHTVLVAACLGAMPVGDDVLGQIATQALARAAGR